MDGGVLVEEGREEGEEGAVRAELPDDPHQQRVHGRVLLHLKETVVLKEKYHFHSINQCYC